MTNSIILSIKSMRGLGANLGHLSMLLHSNKEFNIYANEVCKIFLDPIKEVLGLDNIKIHDEDGLSDRVDHYPNMNDTDKFFAPYINVENISHHGVLHPTGTRDKKFIAIVCYQRADSSEIIEHTDYANKKLDWPSCRYYSIDEYASIFKLARRAGYDVITVDSNEITFADKIFMLNNFCDCIIGYEGGLAHLGHVLKIPTIILPWQRNADGTMPPDTQHIENITVKYSYALHLDKKTYFAKSIKEVIGWSPKKLKEMIFQLHEDQGNNPFLSQGFKFTVDKDYQNYQFTYNGYRSGIHKLSVIASPYSVDFGKVYYKNLLIGGVKEIIQVDSLG